MPSVDLAVERLSGGQRQAIAVARAVTFERAHPAARRAARRRWARARRRLIIDLILRLKARGDLSIVMIMHNYAQTLDIADRIMLMQRGRVTYESATPRRRRSRS